MQILYYLLLKTCNYNNDVAKILLKALAVFKSKKRIFLILSSYVGFIYRKKTTQK